MLRVSSLQIPSVLPHPSTIRSWGSNHHSYEPELWEFQYEIYRYLSSVPAVDLSSRYCAIIRNMHTLISQERHVIPIQSPLSSWYWSWKEHQTRLEFFMRGIETQSSHQRARWITIRKMHRSAQDRRMREMSSSGMGSVSTCRQW